MKLTEIFLSLLIETRELRISSSYIDDINYKFNTTNSTFKNLSDKLKSINKSNLPLDKIEKEAAKIKNTIIILAAQNFVNSVFDKLKISLPGKIKYGIDSKTQKVEVSSSNGKLKGFIEVQTIIPTNHPFKAKIIGGGTELSLTYKEGKDKEKTEYLWTSDPQKQKKLYVSSIKGGGGWIRNVDSEDRESEEEEQIGAKSSQRAKEAAQELSQNPKVIWKINVFNKVPPIKPTLSNDFTYAQNQVKRVVEGITNLALTWKAVTEDESKKEIVITDGGKGKPGYKKIEFTRGPITGYVHVEMNKGTYEVDSKNCLINIHGVTVYKSQE